MNPDPTRVLTAPHTSDVIALRCAQCDARTTVSIADPVKADIVKLFRDAHAGHQPTVTFGRQLHL